MKASMPRYFPSTSCVTDTGADNSRAMVPDRRSSLNRRMVRTGAVNSTSKPAFCRVPATTMLVMPRMPFWAPSWR